MRQLLGRLTELEAQVKKQSDFMVRWHERLSVPPRPPQNMETIQATLHGWDLGASVSPQAATERTPEVTSTSIRIDAQTRNEMNEIREDAHQPAASNGETRIPDGVDSEDEEQDVSLTIPIGHWTTTGSLLLLPQIKTFIGEYPESLFLQLESSRATSVHDKVSEQMCGHDHLQELHADTTDNLIGAFFTYIHPTFPVLDRDMFMPLYRQALEEGLCSNARSGLCLALLALGKMAINMINYPSLEDQEHMHGIEYFAPAYRIATTGWGLSHEADLILPLALMHIALYFQHMNLPLQAWRMVHLTSINLQHSIALYAVILAQMIVVVILT